jgi:broad specificity phosphatase PhoE
MGASGATLLREARGMLEIKLVRHGESGANVGEVDPREVGDHTISLTERGRAQALEAGRKIGADFLRQALVYCSPYLRTRQTLECVLEGSGLARSERPRIYEDPRLREVEHGYDSFHEQEALRKVHGWFYYRFRGGESPADCFDRTSGFLESLMRQVERKHAARAVIITHGLTIRCFVMRFLHLGIEEFESLANPENADVITIAPASHCEAPLFVRGHWAVGGLRRRP